MTTQSLSKYKIGKPQMLEIKKLDFDPTYYPRASEDWRTTASYADAMKLGDEFPPILVAEKRSSGKKRETYYVILDGWHRAFARKKLHYDGIMACIVSEPESKWFEIAVVSNHHGRPLTWSDKLADALKLRKLGYDDGEITNIIKIDKVVWKSHLKQRIVKLSGGGSKIVKKVFRHIAEGKEANEQEVQDSIVLEEKLKVGGLSQEELLFGLCEIIEHNLLDAKNPKIKELVTRLKQLLKAI